VMFRLAIPALAAAGLLAACSTQAPAPSGYAYETPRAAPAPQPVQLMPTPTEAHHVIYTSDLQAALARKGYYHGRVDGDCGPETRRAIAHYQHDLGIPVTGHCQVGDKMWSGLGLSAGDTGPHAQQEPHQRHLTIQ
jgi:Putative peptidoglycan binding domain